MAKHTVNLSTIEDQLDNIPEDVQRVGNEALQIVWQVAREWAHKAIEEARQEYEKLKQHALKERQAAFVEVERINDELKATLQRIESLMRENKSLQVDLNRESGELKTATVHNEQLKKKLEQLELEVRKLTEELGRAKESSDNLQKRLHEVQRQSEQDREMLVESREEAAAATRTRDRLDKHLQSTVTESEKIWKNLKKAQTQTTVAEALTQELRESLQKSEEQTNLVRAEKRELQEKYEAENKIRMDLDKKLEAISARFESQEWAYKEMLSQRDSELEQTKEETVNLRNELIHAKGALEREKKAIERLEAKLFATTGSMH